MKKLKLYFRTGNVSVEIIQRNKIILIIIIIVIIIPVGDSP